MADDKSKKAAAPAAIKKHPTTKRQKNYDGAKPKNRFCPKCGPGIMLANHKDRFYCGKCYYMEKK